MRGSFDTLITADVNNDRKIDILLFGKKEPGLTVLLGDGHGTFSPPTVLFPEQSFSAALVDDFNDDGISDILATNWISNELFLFTGIGKMKFGDPSVLSFEREPSMFDVTYLDTDVNKDLIVGFADDRMYQTYLGDGYGGFHLHQSIPLPSLPAQILTADINGDGWNDVVVFSPAQRTLSVALNNGKGTVEEHVDFDAGASARKTVLLPAAHGIDAAVLDQATSRVRVFYNSQFQYNLSAEPRYGTGLAPGNVLFTDIDHDGLGDILIPNAGSKTISLFFGQKSGRLLGQIAFQTQSATQHLHPYSLNDSTIVLLGTHFDDDNISIMKVNIHNLSSLSFAVPASGHPEILGATIDRSHGFVHIYSLNREHGDGHTSIIEYEQISPSRFVEHPAPSLSQSMLLAASISDFDNDGTLDIAYITFNAQRKREEVYTARSNTSGEFEKARFEFDFAEQSPLVPQLWNADLNHDGVEDLIIQLADPEQSLMVSLGRHDSILSFAPPSFRLKEDISILEHENVVVADLNGDGIPDLVLENYFNKTIQTYPGRGDGTFLPRIRLMSSEGIGGFAIGDINNDHIPELMVSERPNGLLRIISLVEK